MAKLPSADPQRDWPELIAFIGVLAAGTSLIIFGHMSAAGLSTVCAAMVGLFTAFKTLRTPPSSDRPRLHQPPAGQDINQGADQPSKLLDGKKRSSDT